MAVVAPVGAKHQQDTLALSRRFFLSLFNFGMRVGAIGIDVFLHIRWLLQMRRISSFHTYDPPLLSLLLPSLGIRHVHDLSVLSLRLYLRVKDHSLSARSLFQSNDFEFYGASFQAQPEIDIAIGAGCDTIGL